MKVLWIADFGLQHNIGGAQRTDSFVIQEGTNRGHEIVFLNYDTPSDVLNDTYDLVVSGNLENISHRRPDVFQYLLNHPNHVRFEHDSNSYLSQDARKALFNSTKKTIFLSEFHHQTFAQLYGNIFKNVEIVRPFIDSKVFYDFQQERENKTLYVGFFHFLKGTVKFLDFVINNPDKKFVVAGWGSKGFEGHIEHLHNVDYIGKVDHDEMPNLFNKYKTMYYHPEKFEPFCRSVGEAIMCGMQLDVSDNIGAFHDLQKYGIEELTQMCSGSPKIWWDKVE
tara:strand:+ start:323 stop:1162 length:840 start_codon:yes stop_codon:yes gene_type:complete